MDLKSRQLLKPYSASPYSLREDLLGWIGDCGPLPGTGGSVLRALRGFAREADPRAFRWRVAWLMSHFSAAAYKERSPDLDLPVGPIYRPAGSLACGTFRSVHRGVLDKDGVDFLVLKNEYDEVVVAFRGTAAHEKEGDVLRDLKWSLVNFDESLVSSAKAHRGFLDGYHSVESALMALLKKHLVPGGPLYLTGHSLGGAIATITALKLAIKMKQALLPKVFLGLYAFGSPRCLNRYCAEELFAELVPHGFAVLFSDDKIGKIPPVMRRPTAQGYAHIPKVVLVDQQPPTLKKEAELTYGPDYRPEPIMISELDLHLHKISRYNDRLLAIVDG